MLTRPPAGAPVDAEPVALDELDPPARIMMTPGPANLHPRVLRALVAPLVGHKDPYYAAVMRDTADLLRRVFQTSNPATFALPASGGSGMEAALVNLLEPGDTAVVLEAGYFASRMTEIAARIGARVVRVTAEWGRTIEPDQVAAALRGPGAGAKVLAVVHGETSTGVCQPLAEIARLAHDHGALVVVDAVPSLGGQDLPVDALGLDVVYSGSQKCLGAPPGTAPITLSPRAVAALERRKTKVQSWYFDLLLHARYWSPEGAYHHTAPVQNVYALREALRLIVEEGLAERCARHERHSRALQAGLEALGLRLFGDLRHRLYPVVPVCVPAGVDAQRLRHELLAEFDLEIAGGIGELAGRIWRIGVMGYSAQRRNVVLLLAALATLLQRQGWRLDPGAALAAAERVYRGWPAPAPAAPTATTGPV